jgi:hypothetical protein
VARRPVGSDIGRGEKVLAAGDRLGPAELGILAAVGITTVGILTNAPVSTRNSLTLAFINHYNYTVQMVVTLRFLKVFKISQE